MNISRRISDDYCPFLLLVTTGGTIAMVTGDDGIRRPASSTHVGEALAEIAGAPVNACGLVEVDSSQATPAFWQDLLALLRRLGDAGELPPTVITHGTDTLAWTAGMLAAAGKWDAPVVLTAANTPLGEEGSDAPTNLAAAAAVARTAPPGVYVSFAGAPGAPGEVFAGGFVRKVRTDGQAFAGLPQRCGVVTDGVYAQEAPMPRGLPALGGETFPRRVTLVHCHPALDVSLLLATLDAPARPDAIVLELYACGTAPASAVELAAAAVARGIDVLACPPSPLKHREARYGSTAELQETGAQVHLGATVELLVPVSASAPGTADAPSFAITDATQSPAAMR